MRLFLLAALVALSACQTTSASRPAPHYGLDVISAPAAVLAAADAAPRGYPGRFGMVVKRAEQVGPRLFLNSEADYRDQRSIAIAIEPLAQIALRRIHGPDLRAAFLGKAIQVDGVARRERIDFLANGRRTGKYYYQTHVAVTRADQITLVP